MRHKLVTFTLIVLALVVGPSVASFAGDRTLSLESGGRARTYLVHTPPSYDGKKPVPVVIVVHGGAGNYQSIIAASQFSPKADREGFIVVYPNGSGRLPDRLLTWNAGNGSGWALAHKVDDVGFIRNLVGRLEKDFAVDPKRVFVAGLSNGGMMAYRLACELSGTFAAIGVVSGALAADSPPPDYPVSVVIFHGTADEHILYNGGRPKKTIDYSIRNDTSVSFAVSFWVQRDGCAAEPVREQKGGIIHDTHAGGEGGTAVELYTITGGGHAWPGGRWNGIGDRPTAEISATDLIWGFFAAHPKP